MESRARSSSFDEVDSGGVHHWNQGSHHVNIKHASSSFATSNESGNSNAAKASTQARRLYRTAANKSLSVTREIAALDFLVGIPLETEGKIVRDGWVQERRLQKEESKTDNSDASDDGDFHGAPTSLQGKWWEKWIKASNDTSWSQNDPAKTSQSMQDRDNAELERPEAVDRGKPNDTTSRASAKTSVWQAYAPGRRLEGDDAIRVQIPVTTKTLTKQRSIARQAALREWESQTAHGIVDESGGGKTNRPPLADGRLFFSAAGAYPVSVFSMIRYEPRKEEQQLRRQKLEALGGGGSQFVPPTRDWRGVSYRSLLPRKRQNIPSFFDRFRSEEIDSGIIEKYNVENSSDDDNTSTSSSSSEDSDEYQPALIDDPEMKLGRHRNVIVGDKALGPVVCSTIQFVEPRILKAELNKQFRERFDGWEPPRGARKYIGAKVVNGEYKLMDPTVEYGGETDPARPPRKSQESFTSERSVASEKDAITTTGASTAKEMQIRMPPSLTLSKIRSLKHQALIAAVKAKLEIGTVALASVYFERLCLDCRVDKSNRRLTFAVCMLLAAKLNEPNVGLVMKQEKVTSSEENEGLPAKLYSLVRPNERSNNMFESLLGFFTQDWNLSLKRIFDAEWGVFAALGFSLHANPSHVAFHFRRMLKTLEWNVRDYLGRDMHDQWLRALEVEEDRQRERDKRKERKRREREERILNLRIEIENEVIRRKTEEREEKNLATAGELSDVPASPTAHHHEPCKRAGGANVPKVKSGGMRFLSRMRRVTSSGKVTELVAQSNSEHAEKNRRGSGHAGFHLSPSLPALSSMVPQTSSLPHADEPKCIAIDIPVSQQTSHDDRSLGSLTMEGEDGALLV